MARIEPGLYEPSDDVRVFDGAEDDYDDEGSRLPLLIVIALLVLAAFAGVVWLAYTQGVQRGRQDVPRVIAAETGPVKTAPDQPGGAANPYKGLKIYNNKAPVDTQEARQNAAPLPSIITQPGEPMFSAFGPKHHPTAEAEPAKPASAPAPAPQPQKLTQAPAQSAPQAARTSAPAPAPAHPPAAQVAAVKPAPVQQAKPAAPPPAPLATATPLPPPPAAAPTAAGAYVAQIAAFKTQAEAEAGWASFKRNHPAVLGNMSPNIVAVDLGEKGTWYRLRTGSFADKAAAADFCSRLKAEGASCLPAKG